MSAYQPYPKYKASGVEWVGKIPSHWMVAPTFAKVIESKSKNSLGLEENVLSLSYGNIVRRNVEDNYGLMPESFNTYQIVKPGDVILRLTDLQNDKRSLRVGMATEDGIITSAYLTLRGKSEVEPSYLYRLLHSFDTTKVFYGMGGGLRQSMKFDDFRRLPILLPPLSEQCQIAAFLDRECGKLDALQAKQERLIDLLTEKRQALISHAVTRGLDSSAKLKPSGIEWLGDVPAHWLEGRIKTISVFTTSGPRGWSELVGETGALFVQSGDLNDRLGVEFASSKRVVVGNNAEASRTRLRDGDVVVCITGAKTGNVAVCDHVPEEAYINQHLCLIRPNRKVAPRFVATVLKSHLGRSYFDVSQYGLKQGLSLEDVLEAPMPLPPPRRAARHRRASGREVRQARPLEGEGRTGHRVAQGAPQRPHFRRCHRQDRCAGGWAGQKETISLIRNAQYLASSSI